MFGVQVFLDGSSIWKKNLTNFEIKSFLIFFVLFFTSAEHKAFAKPPLIAIEGSSEAGKTTALTNLIKYYSKNCILLPEKFGINKDCLKVLAKFATKQCFIMDRTYFSNIAYAYATKSHDGYIKYVEWINQNIKDAGEISFDLIIVLMVSPRIALERQNITNNYFSPFDNVFEMYNKIRIFYEREFPKIYKGRYIYINTDKLTQDDVNKKILDIFSSEIELDYSEPEAIDKQNALIKDKILSFARENSMSRSYTDIISVLGYPTIYFKQKALQIDENGKVVYLDSDRLDQILTKTYQN